MFSKPSKPSTATSLTSVAPTPPAADAGPRRAPTAPSLIAEDVTLEGSVSGEAELHIDGVIKGDVRVCRLSVGETATIEGTVTAETVECRGRVIGAIVAKQVRLYGTAHVDGDITHEQLAMEPGAFFQGRSLKFPRQAQPSAPLISEILLVTPVGEVA